MAVEVLVRIRSGFVDKASTALIKQLLDDLFDDGVLNDGEKDSVLEENPGRADKARALIDMVRRKGDDASQRMITHLRHRDETLYSELGI